MTKSSEAPGFYKKEPSERLAFVKEFADLSEDEVKTISGYGALGKDTANRMIENVVGTFPLPLGFAPNFQINGKETIFLHNEPRNDFILGFWITSHLRSGYFKPRIFVDEN